MAFLGLKSILHSLLLLSAAEVSPNRILCSQLIVMYPQDQRRRFFIIVETCRCNEKNLLQGRLSFTVRRCNFMKLFHTQRNCIARNSARLLSKENYRHRKKRRKTFFCRFYHYFLDQSGKRVNFAPFPTFFSAPSCIRNSIQHHQMLAWMFNALSDIRYPEKKREARQHQQHEKQQHELR